MKHATPLVLWVAFAHLGCAADPSPTRDERVTMEAPVTTQAQASCLPSVVTVEGEAGEAGPAGPSGESGPTGPRPFVSAGFGLSGDGSDGSPLAINPSATAHRQGAPWVLEAELADPAASRADATASAGGAVIYESTFAPGDIGLTAFRARSAELGFPLAKLATTIFVRIKVTNAASASIVGQLRCRAIRAGGSAPVDLATAVPIVPNQFSGNLAWREFVLSCPFLVNDLEQSVVVDGFATGITDLWVDRVMFTAGPPPRNEASWVAQPTSGTGNAYCAAYGAVCVSAQVVAQRCGTCVSTSSCTAPLSEYHVVSDCGRELANGFCDAACPPGFACSSGSPSSMNAYSFSSPLVTCVRTDKVLP